MTEPRHERGPVLVTGAFGQLGSRVVQILLDRGQSVVGLDLKTETTMDVAAQFNSGSGSLTPTWVDLTDADSVMMLVGEHQPECIVHLAAIVAPPCYRNPAFARRVNVGGTQNLVTAAKALQTPPAFIEASSSSVYGSRNPHAHPERIDESTPTNPIDCYGEDKVLAEQAVAASGLPHSILRLGGILSPDTLGNSSSDYGLLMRATPGDNRIHAVDCRDAALAFANAAELGDQIDGRIFLIGGNESYVKLQRDLEDDLMSAMGIGRLGPRASLPGDPSDERGWGLTDWFDTAETQRVLQFQEHDWEDTVTWVVSRVGVKRYLLRVVGPVVRRLMLSMTERQRRKEGRGPYADPWSLISARYGDVILAGTDIGPSE